MVQLVNNLPAMWETWVVSLGWEDPYSRERRIAESIDTATPAPTSEKNKDGYSDLLY